MSYVCLSPGSAPNERCWVLTADTLAQSQGAIIGKPRDHQDAIAIIKRVRDGVDCSTGFCIERRVWDGSRWHTQDQVAGAVYGWCSLAITDNEIEPYFQALKQFSGFDYLKLAGAFSITGYGAQYLKEVRGNYYAILGLPMAEVRAGLKKLQFSLP
jgi:septum formation protein